MSAIEFVRWRAYFPLIEEMKTEMRNEREVEEAIRRRKARIE